MGENTVSALPEYRSFDVAVENHIAHVQFSRPEALNSMNKDFWLELPRCLRDIETGTDARVVVISSTGKHFSAGMDLAVFSDPSGAPMGGDQGRMAENLRRVVLQLQDCLSVLEQVRIPVIILGGAHMGTPEEILRTARESVAAGGLGVAFGRVVWGYSRMRELIRALKEAVYLQADERELVEKYNLR
jgi:enoyl-CoA hydratase/carnithine racemase